MATGTLTISGQVVGGLDGPKTIAPPVIHLPYAVDDRESAMLVRGDNEITVPVGATICVVRPPDNNTVALATGAGGADPKAPNLPFVQTFPALNQISPAALRTFIVNAADDLSAPTLFDFA